MQNTHQRWHGRPSSQVIWERLQYRQAWLTFLRFFLGSCSAGTSPARVRLSWLRWRHSPPGLASARAGGGAEAIWDIVDRQEGASRGIIYGWSHHGRQAGVGSDEDMENRRFCGLDRSSGRLVTLKTVENHTARVLLKPLDHVLLADPAIFFIHDSPCSPTHTQPPLRSTFGRGSYSLTSVT